MKLNRLMYVSDAACPLVGREIDALVEKSCKNNAAQGITGVLLNSGGYFLQVLEGDPERVEALYTRISADPRHKNVQTLLRKESDKRFFSSWGMELLNPQPWRSQNRAWIDITLARLRRGICETEAQEVITLLRGFRKQFSSKAA